MTEKVLSDGEMDALMDGVASGKVAVQTDSGLMDATVQPYEINPRAYLRFGSYPELQRINDRVALQLQQFFRRELRWEASCDLKSQIELTAFEAKDRYAGLQLSLVYELSPLPAMVALLPDQQTIFALLETFFGSRTIPKSPAGLEAYSNGQIRIAERFASQFFLILSDVWEPICALEPALVKIEQSMERVSLGASKDNVIVSTFQIEAEDFKGEFVLLLPVAAVATELGLLEGAELSSSTEQNSYWEMCLTEHARNLDVALVAQTAAQRLALGRVSSLEKGMVLPLAPPQSVSLYCGKTELLNGDFGSLNNNSCVRIKHWNQPEKSANRRPANG